MTQGFHQTRLNITPTIDPGLLFDISIYPNPTKSYIKIEFNQTQILPTTYYIIDIKGSIVQKGDIFSHTKKLDVSKLSNGMYFITFKYDNSFFLSELKFNKLN
jgi:hypothetical protein